ncbi:MAG: WecB/TagA/CpsF family glycosyltransferase [Anaerolineae bacterium]|nr:WecB/TagA/CpsF family glycosyltransferase [Anaerolineae bacterium]
MEFANVLGVKVSAVNIPMALNVLDKWIKNGEHNYVTITGVHGVMESQRDELIRQIHNEAGMVTPDGMPLVWANKLQGYSHVDRVYGPDLMLAVCNESEEKGYKHFFYGGADGVPELLSEKLLERFPKLNIVGKLSPPFIPAEKITERSEQDDEIVKTINDSGADIVWVGLSTPKQELFMHSHLGRINAPVMIGVGAAFDFHAGLKSQAPYWMQRSGTEWLYRLLTEPKRLARRYLINNPTFLALAFLQATGLRRYELPTQSPSTTQAAT